jgi:hypothetical protein
MVRLRKAEELERGDGVGGDFDRARAWTERALLRHDEDDEGQLTLGSRVAQGLRTGSRGGGSESMMWTAAVPVLARSMDWSGERSPTWVAAKESEPRLAVKAARGAALLGVTPVTGADMPARSMR